MLAASNCGATALLNVLTALKVSVPTIDQAERAVQTNSRKYRVSTSEYLLARSVAGCTGDNIVDGCTAVAGQEVISRFFAFYPVRDVSIQLWLVAWISKGCSAVATINTQIMYGADYWHHQMIHGVDGRGVYMTNPVERLGFDELRQGLESDSALLVQNSDVRTCRPQVRYDAAYTRVVGLRSPHHPTHETSP